IGPPRSHAVVPDRGHGLDDDERHALSDLINRVLDKGVVISGHVTISVADIDLIALDLRLLVSSIQTAMARGGDADAPRSP
ncbi:MAG: gas vesicle protein, partial [Gemmatimonadota bacterium]|nr:gas vesicle protein [Gemmatimonadota bacterium]